MEMSLGSLTSEEAAVLRNRIATLQRELEAVAEAARNYHERTKLLVMLHGSAMATGASTELHNALDKITEVR